MSAGHSPEHGPGSTAGPGARTHGVHRFLGRLHEVLDGVSTDTAWALGQAELAECLREAYAAQARLSALTLALLAQADRAGLAGHDGQISLTAWLREHVRVAPGEAKRHIRLAKALEERATTRVALAAGSFPAASAAVVTDAVAALPDEVDEETKVKAEVYLAGEAHEHDTSALRHLAAHLEEVLDPDGADERLAAQLARAEAKAAREAFLTLRHDEQHATTEGTFRIPLLSGIRLQRMLESLTNPGRPDPLPTHDPETGHRYAGEERRGQALVELLERYPTTKLPKLGGSAPTVVLTLDLATLMGGLKAACLDTGQVISPGAARRLAAQAGIIPAVLGSASEVLDLGRRVRFHTGKQRLAMVITQRGTCGVEGCTRSAIGADGHHLIAYHLGGLTNLADGVLLCPPHHTYADHPDYTVTRLGPGRIRIHRRC